MMYGANIVYRYKGEQNNKDRIYIKEVILCVEADDFDGALIAADKAGKAYEDTLNKQEKVRLWEYVSARKATIFSEQPAEGIPEATEITYSDINFYKSSDRHDFLNKKEVKLPYFC